MENITPPFFVVNPPEGRGGTVDPIGTPIGGVGVLVPFYKIPPLLFNLCSP
jgi:hypothetical protein